MKRGFLNTARSKQAVEKAYPPQSPLSGQPKALERPSPPPAQKPSQISSLVPQQGDSDTNKPAAALTDDAMDVEPAEMTLLAVTMLQEVYADGRAVAVRVTRSTSSEGEAGDQITKLQDAYADGRTTRVLVMRSNTGAEKTPPESRKNDHSTQAEPHHAAKCPEEKGKEKVDNDDATNTSGHNPSNCSLPPRVWRRNPPGWGRHPDEEFFHTVPGRSQSGHWRKRIGFRAWPRDPKGKPIERSKVRMGTLSPDGYLWCATLYDIFYVEKLPNRPDFLSVVTGSAIRETVEALGELDAATPEIEWTKSEGQPRVQGAASTEELIRCLDRERHSLNVQKETEKEQDGGQDTEDVAGQALTEEDGGDEDNGIPTSSPIATSPLHPGHDPKRYSFTPFENQPQILLQERIPLYLLPQTLHVHDPFNLLTVERRFRHTSWMSRPDIVRTHNLRLSEIALEKCEDARQKAEELEEFKARTLIVLRYQRTKEQIKNNDPVIEVLLPPYLRRPTKVEESHLYLSPVAKVGEGNHSIVYKGEWELPCNIFMKQKICSLCFQKSVDEEVQRLKETGRWEKMVRAASWGPNGFTGSQLTVQAELDEVNDPSDVGIDREIIEREITCVVPPNADPSKTIETIDQTDIWDRLMKKKGGVYAALLHFAMSDGGDESRNDSCVAVVRISPPFSYETQKSCTHDCSCGPAPRTAIFTVIAKLSIEGDPHLSREANNYQMFPERFFEHYDGYTIISQIHAIVPVNAVIPQFYGYYVPETSKTKGEPPYISPILLLEHCGKPINPEELSTEDQEECMSLLLRFQGAGWLHESVAPRNFLVQHGKPTEFPSTRQRNPELSFRLIDFGRSRKYDGTNEKRMEEVAAFKEMFKKLVESTWYIISNDPHGFDEDK